MRRATDRHRGGLLLLLFTGLAFTACVLHTNGEQPPGGTTTTGTGGATSSSTTGTTTTSSSTGGGGADPCGPGAPDSDGDGVPDACDVCPGHDDKADADGDGVPDGCDLCAKGDDHADADGDGVPDACDVCPGHDDKADADGDGVPDGCDVCAKGDDHVDADHDGVPDACDACPGKDDKADADGDGIPDGCDTCPYDGPTAPAVTDTVQVPNGIGISNLVLNDSGKNVVLVDAGAMVSFSLGYTMQDCSCSGCVDQIEIGLVPGKPQTCPYSGSQHCQTAYTNTATGQLQAPAMPGAYAIRFDLRQDYSCLQTSNTWWGGTPPAGRTVGYICVK